MTSKMSLKHGRLTLELDATQVSGAGLGEPALVRAGNACSNLWCAIREGRLRGGAAVVNLTADELKWLGDMELVAQVFLYGEDDDDE